MEPSTKSPFWHFYVLGYLFLIISFSVFSSEEVFGESKSDSCFIKVNNVYSYGNDCFTFEYDLYDIYNDTLPYFVILDYNDGAIDTVPDTQTSVNHTFPDTGKYEVLITAVDSFNTACKDTFIFYQKVYPVEAFWIIDTIDDSRYYFDAVPEGGSGEYDVQWQIEDTTIWGIDFAYSFDSIGTYPFCMYVSDMNNSNCSDTLCDSITITNLSSCPLIANLDVYESEVCFEYSFDATFDNNGQPYEYYWDFGDTLIYDMNSINYTFPDTGVYNVCLNARDSADTTCTYSVCKEIHVYPPTGGFTYDANGLSVDFYSEVEVNPDDYDFYWYFGDMNSESGQYVSHSYDTTGWYEVCLELYPYTQGCTYTVCDSIYVDTTTCDISGYFDWYNLNDDMEIEVVPQISGSTEWGIVMDWDDGTSDTSDYMTADTLYHVYPTEGSYNVCMYMMDLNDTTCTNYSCSEVNVDTSGGAETVSFYTDLPGSCAPLNVHFENTSDTASLPGDIIFKWTLQNEMGEQFEYYGFQFPDTTLYGGYYSMSLHAYDTSNTDYGSYWEDFSIDGSHGRFYPSSGPTACPGEEIILQAQDNWNWIEWHLEDGSKFYDNYIPVTFEQEGMQNITLIIDTYCDTDTIVQGIEITNSAVPTATIHTKHGDQFCPNDEVAFQTPSEGTYHWDFGDGYTSTKKEPLHKYSTLGTYEVVLTVTNICGNSNTDTMWINIVDEVYPDSWFDVYSESFCPNTPFKFMPYSAGSHFWDFGDGEFSSKMESVHFYADTGEYNVMHVVTNGCGYSDTAYSPVYVDYDPYYNTPYVYIELRGYYDEEVYEGDTVSVCPGEEVYFENYSGGGDGDVPVMYDWIIDGSDTVRTKDLAYSFGSEGYHTVRFIAFNACGAGDTLDFTVHADPGIFPDADLGHTPDTICPGEDVYFYDNIFNPDAGIHYNIYFGDGDSLMNITDITSRLQVLDAHTYDSLGEYPFIFEAVNTCGNVVQDTGTIVVDDNPDRKPFYYVQNSTQSLSSDVYKGDLFVNMVSEDSIPFITFVNDSIYRIGIAYMPEDPMPDIISEGLYSHDSVGQTIEFISDQISCGSDNGYYSYEYIEGNDSLGYPDSLTFILTNDPCLIRQDILNANTFFYAEDTEDYEDLSACPGDSVYFEIAGGATYEWYFGDGSPVEYKQFPSHAYDSVGDYNAWVAVTNNCGREDTLYSPVTVSSTNLPEAWFDIEFPNGNIANQEIEFYYQEWNLSVKDFSFHWDFGDGTTSNKQNPVHTYTSPGEYTIWFYVENGCGSSAEYQKIYIEEGSDCAAEFSFFINQDNDSVAFYDESYGQPTNWNWTFGDGTSSKAQNTGHKYTEAGYYDVCLNIHDSITGCADQFCDVIYIQSDSTDTTANCYANFEYVVDTNTVSFSNTSEGSITSYYWEFGDGVTSTVKDPAHTYKTGGFYDVCLTAYDTVSGCVDAYCIEIEVVDTSGDPVCNADYGYFIEGTKVSFSDKSSGDATNYLWEFGDGTYADSANPVHIYDEEGYYDVCLTIYDSVSGCMDEVCKTIEVIDTTEENCNASFTYYIESNKVYFTDKSQGNITHYMWNFGDGSYSDTSDVVHAYDEPGFYEVCFTVYDEVSGCMDEYCKVIQVMFEDTTTCLADFSKMISGNTVNFTDKSLGNITNYMWDFGDGTHSDKPNPKHTYEYTDFFQVCLTVYDSVSGCMDEYCKVIQVIVEETASCKAEFTRIISDNKVTFTNKSQGDITNYMWDFDDGTYAHTENPVHEFEHPDFYDVWLTVYDSVSGCLDEYNKVIQVMFEETAACNSSFTKLVSGNKAQFSSTSQGNITNYFWSFGDGSYAYSANPSHEYDEPDFYEVCLTVYDSVSGCMNDYCRVIQIVDTTQNLCNAEFSRYVEGSTAFFNNKSSGDITNYFWNFGDGAYAYVKSPNHTYKQPGFYEVCLSVFDSESGCLDDYCKVIQITDSAFTNCNANWTHYTEGSKMFFTDKSKGDITNYFWSFDDGTYAYTANPTHTYTKPDFYEVCLAVYDEKTDCMDEFCKVIQVVEATETLCKADFGYHTEQKKVSFKNKSQGTFTNYFWDLGDGNYSYKREVSHEYTEQGYYEVMLIVYDTTSSCIDERYKIVSVIDTSAEETICNARFTAYNNEDSVFFKPKALGDYTSIFWEFGDDFNSNEERPVHIYDEPGYYDVYLTVMDTVGGCFDSRNKEIYVEGVQKAEKLSARFSYFVDSSKLSVDFEDESFGNPSDWYWDFGDNSTPSTEQNPDYIYSSPGYYKVCLTISNGNNAQKTRCKNITVGDISEDLVPYFTYFADNETSTAHFNNECRGNIDSYLWDFGDGVTSEQKNPSHTYADTGVYAVCLTVTHATSGVSESYCRKVRVGNAIQNPCVFSCVWPGDANKDLEANHYDIMTIGLNFGMQGPARDSISNRWIGHFAQDWATYQLSGVNNKHGDCNGDGVINWSDTVAIHQNFAYSHYEQPGSKADENWIIEFDWSDSKAVTRRKGKVQLGPPVKGTKANIYALGYEIEILGAGDSLLYSQTTVNFDDNWLGSSGSDLIAFYMKDSVKSKIYVGLARNDGQEISGDGAIAEINFTFMEGFDSSKVNLIVSSVGGGILNDGSPTGIKGSLSFNLGDDIDMCEGDSKTIHAPVGFDSYLWSTGEDTSSIEVTESGTYTVTITDESGITGTDDLTVTVHNNPVVDLGSDIEAVGDTTLDAGSGFEAYEWSTGETTQAITVTEEGTYSVTVTNMYGCTASDSIDVTFVAAGIEQPSELAELKVYPNPAEDILFVEIESQERGEMVIQLVDQTGARFYRQKLGKTKTYSGSLNVSRLAGGIYYLQVVLDDKVVGIEKVVID